MISPLVGGSVSLVIVVVLIVILHPAVALFHQLLIMLDTWHF